MAPLDVLALGVYTLVLIGIGVWAYFRVNNASDFYVAAGKVPWWLSGVSHHVSGYTAVVFTGFASIAYKNGVSIYLWWALSIALMVFLGSYLIAPCWARLRSELGFQSPTTYLVARYGLPTQQLIVWSGVFLKLLDVAAKWVAIAIILNGFLGVDIASGIVVGSGLSLLYIAIGGIWADLANDFFQFVLQVLCGVVMFVAVLKYFGGWSGAWAAWQTLPADNRSFLREPYDAWYTVFYAIIIFMSYNGGTWNLAMRFMSSSNPRDAQWSARLSAALYVVWPLVLFVPLWLSPVIFPGLSQDEATQVYSMMAEKFIPAGLFGLVIGGMVAATFTMTASDTNAISAVITQDILPVLWPSKFSGKETSLRTARATTIVFVAATVVIALNHHRFGGINGLIITWFGALLGPAAIPQLFGLLHVFKKCDQRAAIATMLVGFGVFALFKVVNVPYSFEIGGPTVAALCMFVLFAVINRKRVCRPEVEMVVNAASGTTIQPNVASRVMPTRDVLSRGYS